MILKIDLGHFEHLFLGYFLATSAQWMYVFPLEELQLVCSYKQTWHLELF